MQRLSLLLASVLVFGLSFPMIRKSRSVKSIRIRFRRIVSARWS